MRPSAPSLPDKFAAAEKIDFVISISVDPDTVPEELKKYMI